MKRFHIGPIVLLATSFLLSMTWGHSFHALDRMYILLPGGGCLSFASALGVVGFEYRNDHSTYEGRFIKINPWADMNDDLFGPGRYVRRHFEYVAAENWHLARLRRSSNAPTGQITCWGEMRYWQVVLITLLWPIWHVISKVISRRRIAPALCPTCAYDLRMHHPGDKCPECGTPISS